MSVGCYLTKDSCKTDVFNETLSSAQCKSADASSYDFKCATKACEYYYLTSGAKMTAEFSLQTCNSCGFRYAGLRA